MKLRTVLLIACIGAAALFLGGAQGAVSTVASATTQSRSLVSVTRTTTRLALSTKRRSSPAPLGWVRNLQRDLTKLRFYSGPVTGLFTPQTKAAVIRFQKAAHLTPDGEWGPKSQAALDRLLGRRPSHPKRAVSLGWVRNLQRDLTKLRFYSGPVTGLFTPQTKAAVIRFQKAAHLTPDGEWGPKSQAALDKMLHRRT